MEHREELNNNNNKKPYWVARKGLLIYALIVVALVSFMAGFFIGESQGDVEIVSSAGYTEYGELQGKDEEIPQYLKGDVNFETFWDVWNTIQNNYIDRPVGESKLFYGALNGMVASLDDPYSMFLEPKTASDFADELEGHFEGIGAEIGIRDDNLTVVSPLSESPAEKAGLRAQDIILQIDGYDTEDIDLREAVRRIRGKRGSVVTLKIYRSKNKEVQDIDITRDVIEIVSVETKSYNKNDYELLGDKQISFIKVTNFHADTSARFKQAVQNVLTNNPDGIILDLRSNPGGFLNSAIELSDYWLNQGQVVVQEEYAEGDPEIHKATSQALLDKYPTVVLVDGGSASGSEIVAGALKDHKLATLIGEKTFGKGSVQQLIEVNEGSAVKLTIARWLTPNGTTIDNEGIQPDIEVERTVEDYQAGKDPQLDRAIRFFNQN